MAEQGSMLTTMPSDEIRAAAAAIANARGMRRGVPEIANILEMLPKNLAEEVLEDAARALEAVEKLRSEKCARLRKSPPSPSRPKPLDAVGVPSAPAVGRSVNDEIARFLRQSPCPVRPLGRETLRIGTS